MTFHLKLSSAARQEVSPEFMASEEKESVPFFLPDSTNYYDHGTFNMLFKKANPIWEILAHLPDSAISVALTGGGNAFGPLIDIALTAAASVTRFAKANSWSTGGDPLVLDLSGRGLSSSSLDGSEVHFDMNNDFFSERTGWIGSGPMNDNKVQNHGEAA
jgi:hypothetical protein